MRIFHKTAAIVAFATAITGVQAQTPATPKEGVVATLNGKPVTEDMLTSFAMQLEINESRRFGDQKSLLDEFILTEFYDKVPTTASIEVTSDEAKGPSPYTSMEARQLIRREFQKDLMTNVDVPRADMEAWYKTNVSRYVQPEKVHAWHLFMETSDDNPSSSPEKVRARLKEIKAEADSGTSFSQLAEKYSEAASGKTGGEIGEITPRMPIGPLSKPMNLELETVFFSLKSNQVSDVVETRHGFHLLYITDKMTTVTPSLDDLITSKILPGVLSQDRLTSSIKESIAKAAEKHKAKILPDGADNISSDTVAFAIGDKKFTVGDLTAEYGRRFTSFLDSAKGDPEALKDLMKQVMDDELLLWAAMDAGIDKRPAVASEIAAQAERSKARKRIDAIVEAESKVSPEAVEERYNSLIEELRRPEAEGWLVSVYSKESSGTAEEAKAREEARQLADQIHERLGKEDFAKVAQDLKNPDLHTSVVKITRHVMGNTTDTESRMFDQAAQSAGREGGVGQVMPMGSVFMIARVDKAYPGSPIPLADIKDRLEQMVRSDLQKQIRSDLVKRLEKIEDIKYLAKRVMPSQADGATSDAD